MKTKFRTLLAFSAATLIAIAPIQAQEYDDMYFTPKDRAAKKKDKAEKVAQVENLETNFEPQESYSQKNVNPDYVAKYSANSYEDENGYAEDEYYIDDYNDNYSQPVANNYYNSGYSSFNNPGMVYSPRWGWYDPFYGPSLYSNPGWSVSIGFSSGWGYNRFGRLSYGSAWGNSWGNYYGYYDNYNSWYGSNYYGYYDPFYYPYRNNIVVINNYESRSNRTYKRSVGPSRTNDSRVGSNSSGTRSRVASNSGDNSGRTNGRVSSTDTDNSRNRYSESVNSRSSYYRRSRVANEVDNGSTNSRSSYGRNSTTPDRSGSYTPRSNSNYGTSRSTRSSSYSTPSNRSRTYNSNSGSRSRSYTSPSPAPSRSRSSGNVGSSPSRSSGSGNRVSTGSSPSRSSSSGSRSSSGSSRKRGN